MSATTDDSSPVRSDRTHPPNFALMEIGTFNVIRHTVNFDVMSRFYGQGLGMSPVEEWDRPQSRGVVFGAQGASSAATIEVLQLGDLCVPGVAPVNIELVLYVDDARAVQDELRGRGMTITRELKDEPWGHRSFGVDDPDGLRIWIIEVIGGD
jgi:catechol 2,3-dioxygenase-like lactoylglutathione lyase family enzyme